MEHDLKKYFHYYDSSELDIILLEKIIIDIEIGEIIKNYCIII